ncbi:hypothetical protein JYU34_005727 [Plutella xylostella]|uniref:Uncharacterized protein n=1 Tax=Plutella xylostella TaxID=51655 RepID=A0ABQ7QTY9_PLUXY|nr:hypothetical protein JYU34_005727 [Plutella xylostella]
MSSIVLRLRLGADPALQGAAGAVPSCIQHTHVRTSIHAVLEVRTDAGEGGVYLATYSAVRNKTNDFSAIKILISAGLDVNQARHDGLRPLDLAALKGHSRLVRFLLAHGATPTDQQDISMIIGKM